MQSSLERMFTVLARQELATHQDDRCIIAEVALRASAGFEREMFSLAGNTNIEEGEDALLMKGGR